jgi:hypothetical protein
MTTATVIALGAGGALVVMVLILAAAAYRHRDARSLERAQREGARGPAGLRRARSRARGE